MASCRDSVKYPGYEYMPDMYRSPSYETNSSNPLFKDSMSNRQPVAGTIARGDALYSDIDRMPYPYANDNDGYEAAGRDLHNPMEKTDANMAEGKRLYENYCTHCHGEKGQGDGLVVQHNGPKPPAYNSDQLKEGVDVDSMAIAHTINTEAEGAAKALAAPTHLPRARGERTRGAR